MYPTLGKSQRGNLQNLGRHAHIATCIASLVSRAASRQHARRWTNDCETRRRETHCHLNALQPHRATLALVPLSFCSSALRLYTQHISSHSAASQYDAVGWEVFSTRRLRRRDALRLQRGGAASTATRTTTCTPSATPSSRSLPSCCPTTTRAAEASNGQRSEDGWRFSCLLRVCALHVTLRERERVLSV